MPTSRDFLDDFFTLFCFINRCFASPSKPRHNGDYLWPFLSYLTLPLVWALSLLSIMQVQPTESLVTTEPQRRTWNVAPFEVIGMLLKLPCHGHHKHVKCILDSFIFYLLAVQVWMDSLTIPYSSEFSLWLLLLPYTTYSTFCSSYPSDSSLLQRHSPNLPTTTEFFMNTTLSKTAQGIELLAASVLILEVLKDVELSESFQEHNAKLELLAILVASPFSPAEA